MTLTYQTGDRIEDPAGVFYAYAAWLGRVLAFIFYPDKQKDFSAPPPPEDYKRWIERALKEGLIAPADHESLDRAQSDLHHSAAALIAVASVGTKPDFKLFHSFMALYDGMVSNLHRLQGLFIQAQGGLDTESGLRNRQAMITDLDREMERRARQGQPFCLVLARIDNYEAIRSLVDDKRMREIIAAIGHAIRECLRSFDDAYRSGDSEFIMSLKHTEKSGAGAAVNRLKTLLQDAAIMIPQKNGTQFAVSLSSCVAEPLPGDTIDDMLANMREDIEKYNVGGNTLLEYFEQSPLQRLVKEME